MNRSLLLFGLFLAGCQNFEEAYGRCVDGGACTDVPGAGGGGGNATGGGGVTGGGAGGGGVTGGGQGGGGGGGAPDAGSGFSVNMTNLSFGPMALNEQSVPQPLEVTNTGAQMINVGINLTGADSIQFGLAQNTCGALLPGAKCGAQVKFAPLGAIGTKTASLEITALGGATQTLPVSGDALAPVTLSATALDFLDVSAGSTSQLPLTLTNNTSLPVTQTRILQGVFGHDGTCVMVGAHTQCTYQVTFSPLDAGVFASSLSTSVTFGPNNFTPPDVALSGNGVRRGSLSFGADPFNNARTDAGTALVRQFTLSSVAPTMVGVSFSLSGTGAAAYSIVDAGCTTIAAGGSCTGLIQFQPAAHGTFNASLTADGGLAGFAFMPMVAQGFEGGRLQWVDDGGAVWATTNSDTTHTFTLRNASSGPSQAVSIALADAGTYGWRLEPDAGINSCVNGVTTLAPSASCNVQVTYLAGTALTPNGTISAVLRATATSASPAVSVLSGTAAYTFVAGPHFGYPVGSPLIPGPITRACNFRGDGETVLAVDAPNGTQLEFKHEPSLDSARCGGQYYYEVPARNSAGYPGLIRGCSGTTASFSSGEGSYQTIGAALNSFCLPTSTTGPIWGSEVQATPVDDCRTTYTRIGRLWGCQ